MPLPGIGWVVASQLVARMGARRELSNSRQLGGFLGVGPPEYSTGDRTDRGSIPHPGAPRLRSNLLQAAWAAIRQDSELREFYRSGYRRHPRDRAARVAIVAVARKLSVRISVVWRHHRA
jgi:transposase